MSSGPGVTRQSTADPSVERKQTQEGTQGFSGRRQEKTRGESLFIFPSVTDTIGSDSQIAPAIPEDIDKSQ